MISAQRIWYLYWIAALCFIPAIWFYYIGEEAIFPIAAMEMAQHGNWLSKTRFGLDQTQNPMFIWMILLFNKLLGGGYALEAARIITICSTIASGLVVAWLTNKLSKDERLAAFAALIYITFFELLVFRGWLAYVDPAFSLAVFASIALMWISILERRLLLLLYALIALSLAFLLKTFTAYTFYGAAILVLLPNQQHRNFLLSKQSVLFHLLAFSFPIVWYFFILNTTAQASFMLWEVTDKFELRELGDYFIKLASFLPEMLLRLAPASLLAFYASWRLKKSGHTMKFPIWWKTAFWIAVLNSIPYWLAPISASRHLLPLYPFFALIFAWPLWLISQQGSFIVYRWIAGTVALQLLVVLVLFPYYQQNFRGENYLTTAQDIIQLSEGHPLYAVNGTASGMSVVAYIDAQIFPRHPIMHAPTDWKNGYVIAFSLKNGDGNMIQFDIPPQPDEVIKEYQLGGDKLYLLCRGASCTRQ